MESDAVRMILQSIKEGNLQMMLSPVHYFEIEAISDVVERFELLGVINNIGRQILVDRITTRNRAENLIQKGMGIADAAHVAFAEAASADFISCDDKLLKKCEKAGLTIWHGDPLQFCIKEDLR